MQSLPILTTGHPFLHSCLHFLGLHLSEDTMATYIVEVNNSLVWQKSWLFLVLGLPILVSLSDMVSLDGLEQLYADATFLVKRR